MKRSRPGAWGRNADEADTDEDDADAGAHGASDDDVAVVDAAIRTGAGAGAGVGAAATATAKSLAPAALAPPRTSDSSADALRRADAARRALSQLATARLTRSPLEPTRLRDVVTALRDAHTLPSLKIGSSTLPIIQYLLVIADGNLVDRRTVLRAVMDPTLGGYLTTTLRANVPLVSEVSVLNKVDAAAAVAKATATAAVATKAAQDAAEAATAAGADARGASVASYMAAVKAVVAATAASGGSAGLSKGQGSWHARAAATWDPPPPGSMSVLEAFYCRIVYGSRTHPGDYADVSIEDAVWVARMFWRMWTTFQRDCELTQQWLPATVAAADVLKRLDTTVRRGRQELAPGSRVVPEGSARNAGSVYITELQTWRECLQKAKLLPDATNVDSVAQYMKKELGYVFIPAAATGNCFFESVHKASVGVARDAWLLFLNAISTDERAALPGSSSAAVANALQRGDPSAFPPQALEGCLRAYVASVMQRVVDVAPPAMLRDETATVSALLPALQKTDPGIARLWSHVDATGVRVADLTRSLQNLKSKAGYSHDVFHLSMQLFGTALGVRFIVLVPGNEFMPVVEAASTAQVSEPSRDAVLFLTREHGHYEGLVRRPEHVPPKRPGVTYIKPYPSVILARASNMACPGPAPDEDDVVEIL